MKYNLEGKKVAILVTDGFEQSELESPLAALQKAGAEVHIVSPKTAEVRAWDESDWGDSFPVDVTLEQASERDYDALHLPGGVINPDKLRLLPVAVKFVQAFFKSGKPVGAICHGPQILIEAAVVRGRKLTSYPSLKTDLINAGANWVDEVVVVDQGLVTSRKPDDLPRFNEKLVEEISEGIHQGQKNKTAFSTAKG